jgi:hypothetical protein
MNVALGAVFIFILLTPPIAFYVSYSFGRFAKAGPKFNLLDGLLASSIISLFIHSIGVLTVGSIPESGLIRFDVLIKIVGGDVQDFEKTFSNQDFNAGLTQFAFYNAFVLTLAVTLGRLLRSHVLRNEWHHNNELLRLNNKWWYLFNGYHLPEIGFESRDFDLLFVDVAIDLKEETVIYSGYLVDFVCNGEELDRMYLSDTVKRGFPKASHGFGAAGSLSSMEPHSIPGAFFSISYKDIKNINLRFLTFENSRDEIEDIHEGGLGTTPTQQSG